MSRRLGLFVVEGPQDCAVLGRLLSHSGLTLLQKKIDLDAFWAPAVPLSVLDSDKLELPPRLQVPSFFQNATHSVAILVTGGDSGLVRQLNITLKLLPDWKDELGTLAIFLDADNKAPLERWRKFCDDAKKQSLPLALPELPGEVAGTPRAGGYVFPDNKAGGTLEDLLLAAGGIAYPALLHLAREYVERVDLGTGVITGALPDSLSSAVPLTAKDLDKLKKPSGRNKAILGTVGSILRPGKAVQNTIADNRWLEGATLDLPMTRSLRDFLHLLLAFPVAAPAAAKPPAA